MIRADTSPDVASGCDSMKHLFRDLMELTSFIVSQCGMPNGGPGPVPSAPERHRLFTMDLMKHECHTLECEDTS